MIIDIIGKIRGNIIDATKNIGISNPRVSLEHPDDLSHGDYSTNIALVYSKSLNTNPRALAEKIVDQLKKNPLEEIDQISIAGPGFINFKLKDSIFSKEILAIDTSYGKGNKIPLWQFWRKNEQVLVEYTDPNAFKVFHIGHLMANAIGESISRLVEYCGADVTRICYPSDIGLHIAKTIWAIQKHREDIPASSVSIQDKTAFLGKMYVEGTTTYDTDSTVKIEIDRLNKVLYDKSDKTINELYEKGRAWSFEHFELLYKRLDTKFDEYIYESEMASVGLGIVRDFIKKAVFEESQGAVIFPGEKHGLHTRVFVNALGLPTYEAKEIGLNITKFKKHPKTDTSIIITANEQNDYFKVVKRALSMIDENAGSKTLHIGHGLLRFADGKMSSRTGKVITAEALLSEVKELVINRIADRGFTQEESDTVSDVVAIAAIKYMILRQATGGDIIYDPEKAISFEGDSGPYLQYACVRAQTVLEKARGEGVSEHILQTPEQITLLEKLLARFPETVARARAEYAPHHVTTYLTELAAAFNSYYANNQIISKENPLSPYRVALTQAFVRVMKNGLWLLGIRVPARM